jgi:dipeptidyl aminopeptidase/acylaminoacyl peptidase
MVGSGLNLKALISAGAISGVDVSPDGRTVVFASSAGGRPKLYLRDVSDGPRIRPLETGREGATQPRWSPQGGLISFLQDVGGDENYRICVVDPNGGALRDLTQKRGKLHENHSWAADGSRIAFVSNRDGQFDVYWVDVATAEVHRVTDHPSVHHSPEFSPDGRRLSFCSNRSSLRGNWDTFVISADGGDERKVTRHEGEADEMSYYAGQRPTWSRDGSSILLSSSTSGFYNISAIDVESLAQTPLVDMPHDVVNAQRSPDGGRLAYVVNQDGNLIIYVKELDSGNCRAISQADGSSGALGMRGKGADYRWSPDSKSILYGHMSPVEPGSVWATSIRDGEPRLLYSSLPEGLDKSRLVPPTIVRYQSFDGVAISGLLFQPRGRERIGPAVIMPHGGPTGQATNVWSPLIQHLVSLGYVVFEPNFRGSTGYGREFQWLNRDDWAGGDLRDVVCAAEWLETEGIASGVAIIGGSYGGFMALSAVTQYPDRWRAAVSIYGMANLITMYTTAREDMRHFQERNIGRPDEHPDFYRERSPLNHVDRIIAPILILQGERDARVPLSEAEQMRDALEAGGKQFEYMVYRDEGHGFTKLDTKMDYLERIGAFLRQHLLVE